MTVPFHTQWQSTHCKLMCALRWAATSGLCRAAGELPVGGLALAEQGDRGHIGSRSTLHRPGGWACTRWLEGRRGAPASSSTLSQACREKFVHDCVVLVLAWQWVWGGFHLQGMSRGPDISRGTGGTHGVEQGSPGSLSYEWCCALLFQQCLCRGCTAGRLDPDDAGRSPILGLSADRHGCWCRILFVTAVTRDGPGFVN